MKRFVLLLCVCYVLGLLCACNQEEQQNNQPITVVNTVIFVNFNGGELAEPDKVEFMEGLTTSELGMKAFFLAESLGKCNVESYSAGEVWLEKGEAYYKKYGLISNPEGYKTSVLGMKEHIDVFYREQSLLREAVSKAQIQEGYNPDGDGDGYADAVTLVINADFEGNSANDEKILWPHKSEAFTYSEGVEDAFFTPEGYYSDMGVNPEEVFALPEINGVKIRDYTVVSTLSSVGEVCHEFSHVLGMPDYYSYLDDAGSIGSAYDNIGKYELMGASVGDIPQYSLAYVRSKVGWLEEGKDIQVVNASGNFKLYPVTQGGVQAIKLIPRDFHEKGEFFMIEARKKTDGAFDGSVNSSGVIVYAVKPENAFIDKSGEFGVTDFGNMYGNGKFEIRMITNTPGEFLGMPLNYFRNGDTVGELTFEDGSQTGITIGEITRDYEEGFSFSVAFADASAKEEKAIYTQFIAGENVLSLNWQTQKKGKTYVMVLPANEETAAANLLDLLPSNKSVINGNDEGYGKLYTAVIDNASGQYIPHIEGECFIVAVTESQGEVVFRETKHVSIKGKTPVEPTFITFAKVLFKPWNPAFIAVCGILILLVLSVFITVFIHKKRGKVLE